MRKKLLAVTLLALLLLPTSTALAKKKQGTTANTITHGQVFYSSGHYLAGTPIPTGFDDYGYNYQAHMFRGSYYNSYAGGDGYPAWTGNDEAYLAENPAAASHWAWPYREVSLTMKWNDAWISNVDHDGDNLLDRHWGYTSYDGSGAWLTNHQSGEDEGVHWTYFVKIVTPSTADGDYLDTGVWYNSEGVEIGPVIWGAFAIIQQVESGSGCTYSSPLCNGLGYYQ